MSVRLYIGNLPKELEPQAFEAVFAAETEGLVSVKLIADRRTGKCRGFGFVTVKTDEFADELVEKYNGYLLQETPLKVEKALPRSSKSDGEDTGASESNPQGNRRQATKKHRKASSSPATAAVSTSAVQPDPRWAQDLEKLKALLATQTTAP
jgi:RNA recognition motif-containing protein